jgi:hypothetical protein
MLPRIRSVATMDHDPVAFTFESACQKLYARAASAKSRRVA